MSSTAALVSHAEARRGMDGRLWELLAYGARYGKQPMSELMSMTLADLTRFSQEISKIVDTERQSNG